MAVVSVPPQLPPSSVPPHEALLAPKPSPWWVHPYLATLFVLIYAGSIAASFKWGDTTLQTTLATGALTIATMAAQFFFGSSSGSQKKDDTIAANAASLATSIPAPLPTTTNGGSSPIPSTTPPSGPHP